MLMMEKPHPAPSAPAPQQQQHPDIGSCPLHSLWGSGGLWGKLGHGVALCLAIL